MRLLKTLKINRKIIYLGIINIVFILLLCIVGVSDETKDDLGVQLLISNCDGIAAYYHEYMSAFYAIGVFYLQKLLPQLAWNYFGQIIFILISINVLCNEIMERISGKSGEVFAVLTSIFLFFQSACIFNFTRTAAMLACAGLCLIFHDKKRDKLFGLLLFICGTIVRFSIIYIPVVFIGVILLWKLKNENQGIAKNIPVIGRQYALPIILVFLAAFLIETAGQFYINMQPEWKRMQERCALSAKLMDYELDDYEKHEEVYKKQGISQNDFNMIETRFSNSDTAYFSDEIYNQVYEESSEKWKIDFSAEQLSDWGREIKKYPMHNGFGWYVLAVLILAIICYDKKSRCVPIMVSLSLGAYLLLFCILGRVVDRVTFGLYLSAGTTLLICHGTDMPGIQKWIKEDARILQTLLCLVYIVIAGVTLFMGNRCQRKTDAAIADMYDYMEENQDFFYFYSQMSEYKAISNLLFMKNYWDTGNSIYASDYDFAETTASKYHKYNIHNVYQDAPNSQMIRFIDCSEDKKSRIDMIITYIREHYCKDAEAELLEEIGEYRIYKIVSHQSL